MDDRGTFGGEGWDDKEGMTSLSFRVEICELAIKHLLLVQSLLDYRIFTLSSPLS